MEEVGAVVDASLLAGRTSKDLGAPGVALNKLIGGLRRKGRVSVQMAVKVDDSNGSVFAVDGAEEGKGDSVVTSESDHTGECLAVLGRTRLVGVGVGSAAQEQVVALLNLLEGIGIVIPKSPINQYACPKFNVFKFAKLTR